MNLENEKSVLKLHSLGLTNRSIAKQLEINHKTVASFLKIKNLAPNGTISKSAKYVSEKTIECSKCKNPKHEGEYMICRRNTKYEYRLSYCNRCRKDQTLKNINSDMFKILKDIFLRLKARAKKENVLFDLSYEYVVDIFHKQEGKCFYSGVELSLIRGVGFNKNACTTDKVVPEKGYTKGNIVLCTKRFNTVKSDLSLEEIGLYMPKWYDKLLSTEWLIL